METSKSCSWTDRTFGGQPQPIGPSSTAPPQRGNRGEHCIRPSWEGCSGLLPADAVGPTLQRMPVPHGTIPGVSYASAGQTGSIGSGYGPAVSAVAPAPPPAAPEAPADPWTHADPWGGSSSFAGRTSVSQANYSTVPAAPAVHSANYATVPSELAAHSAPAMPAAPSRSPPSAVPVASTTVQGRRRSFVVDFGRAPGENIGLKIEESLPDGGLKIHAAREGQNPTGAWNERCEKTFPDDMILRGDIICRVNGIGTESGLTEMMDELKRATDLFLVVRRG